MIRTLFRRESHNSISGELTISASKLWLRLRLAGREFYASSEGAEPDNPDQLFENAAREVLWLIDPTIVIATLVTTNPAQARLF
jgi:hypothetical protein